MISRYAFGRTLLLLPALTLCLPTAPAGAQTPPQQPNPQAPTLNVPFPCGQLRGTTLELTLAGANLAGPTALWTNIPGAKAVIPADNNNGKDNAKLRVSLTVPKECPVGTYALRLATARGMSNVRLFCVDELPQVTEAATNRSRTTPQAIPVPAVVAGQTETESSDWYKVTVKAGQRLSFEVLGHRLGTPLDPQLSLYDVKSGRELAGGHSNDAPGLRTDPRLVYTFKEAGDYLVEVRDVMYRGGADYAYRLRIGDFPCATTPLPMAAKQGGKAAVTFAGPAVDGVAPVEVAVPSDPAAQVVYVAPRRANGPSGWPVQLAVSDLEEAQEQEPNNEPGKANRVPVPGAVTARFLEKSEVDHFTFAAKKGQRLIIEAHTHELGSPTEVYLVLKDAKGGQVAASNPAQAPRLDFNPPADGDYVLAAEHLHYWGGPAETYRLTFTPYQPGFEVKLGIDRYDVAPGSVTAIPLFATRRDYAGPIEVSVSGHPGITGQATIPAGQPAQPNQPAATLYLSARPDVASGPYLLAVVGKATINGQVVTEPASVSAPLTQGLAGLVYPPQELTRHLAVAVTEKPPFLLAAKFDQAEALRGAATNVTITATRNPGFAEEIALAAVGLPANVAPALKNIPKGQNEVKVQLTPAANAALGQFPVAFTGKAKAQNQEFSVTAPPVPLVVVLPFELKVEPSPVKLTPGGKATVKVTATRKAGYQGPIALEVKNLPANVTAPKVTIAMGQSAADVELTAAANAAAGDKADVNVTGTATAAGNQTNASPNFTVSVQKK